jgi:hypothetical protein
MKSYTDVRGASSGGGGRAIVKSSPRSNPTTSNELLSKRTTTTTSSSSRASSGPRLPKARACYICGRQYMVTTSTVVCTVLFHNPIVFHHIINITLRIIDITLRIIDITLRIIVITLRIIVITLRIIVITLRISLYIHISWLNSCIALPSMRFNAERCSISGKHRSR